MMSNWNVNDFLTYGLGMGSSDVEFFIKKLNEANENLNKDIGDEVFQSVLSDICIYVDNNKLNGSTLIGALISNLFEIYRDKFIEKVCDYISDDSDYDFYIEELKVKKDDVFDVLFNKQDEIWSVYANFIDTSYDCELDLFDFRVASGRDIKKFLDNFMIKVKNGYIKVDLEVIEDE
jgi:hypothetical protein